MKIHKILKLKYLAVLSLILLSLTGCNHLELATLEAEGPIAKSINELFWFTLGLLIFLLTLVFSFFFWIIFNFRASRVPYRIESELTEPESIQSLLWFISAAIVLALGVVSWHFTYKLDPYKRIQDRGKHLQIEAIALDWKWLFIYPEQNIATINQVTLPRDRPITFKITSNSAMNSFFIPRLGGQIYAMPGMETQLHVLAEKNGLIYGENTQFNGEGFPYQYFQTVILQESDFNAWVNKVKTSPNGLNQIQYTELVKPTIWHKVEYFGSVTPHLFEQVMHDVQQPTFTKPVPYIPITHH